MFRENKYSNWYFKIIENAKNKNYSGYYETHHIIPKCMGGSNSKSNLVKLSAKEHFICHLLLTKMADEPKLKFSLYMMTSRNSHQIENRYKVSCSRIYEYVKKCNSEASKERMVGFVGLNKNKKLFTNLLTNESKFFTQEQIKELDDCWVKGTKQSTKENISKQLSGGVYYYDPGTLNSKKFNSVDEVPSGWVKGNYNSKKAGLVSGFKGSCYFHDPLNGEEIRVRFSKGESPPKGWIKGRPIIWITDGIRNKQHNKFNKLPNGWKQGKTISKKVSDKIKGSRKRPIETPLGKFSHPNRFYEKYKCGMILEDLDNKIRKRGSNSILIDELEKIGYNFNKTKRENGFMYTGE